MDRLFDTGFFKNLTPCAMRMYILYSLSGGMYYEGYIRGKLRYFIIFWSALGSVTITVSCLKTIAIQFDNDGVPFPLGLLFYALDIMVLVLAFISTLLVTYINRKNLKELFNFVNTEHKDDKDDTETDHEDKDDEEMNIMRLVSFAFKYTMFCLNAVQLAKIIQKCLFSETPLRLDFTWDFAYPFPFEWSHTWFTYIFVNSLQVILNIPLFINFFAPLVLLVNISSFFKNQADALRKSIKKESDLLRENVEKSYERELEITSEGNMFCVKTRELRHLAKEREAYYEKFMLKMKEWIQQHQRLNSAVNLHHVHSQTILSWVTVLAASSLIYEGYLLSKMTPETSTLEWEIFLTYALSSTFTLFVCCAIGTMTEEWDRDLIDEFYSTPWYYLPPKYRKTLLTFLSSTQKPRGIFVCKVFPLNLPLLPIVLDKVYKYIQIIKTLETIIGL